MTKLATSRLAINGGKPIRTRPFPEWPRHDDAERRGLLRVLETGEWGGRIDRGQSETSAFEAEFAEFHEAPAALTVTNGTHALQLALDLAGVEPGDHVLVPALTPIPTSNAVRQRGAIPIPVDVDSHTYCLDPRRLDAARTDRCTAVIAVHVGGHVADMERILQWAERTGIAVIQDAAHAHGATWQGRGIGALGTLVAFSFMQTKLMSAGEGGAVLIPDDARYGEAFARHCLGRVPGATPPFQTASSNYRLSAFAAAVLRAQLGRLSEHNERRAQRWSELVGLLAQIPGVTPQGRDPRCTLHPHYLAPLALEAEVYGGLSRNLVAEALQAEGIPAYPLFPPIYRVPAFWDGPAAESTSTVERLATACPSSEYLGTQALFLRHEVLMGDRQDVQDIADAVEKVLGALADRSPGETAS
jgi:3-amino-5-hydroxybenzoate synthase